MESYFVHFRRNLDTIKHKLNTTIRSCTKVSFFSTSVFPLEFNGDIVYNLLEFLKEHKYERN